MLIDSQLNQPQGAITEIKIKLENARFFTKDGQFHGKCQGRELCEIAN